MQLGLLGKWFFKENLKWQKKTVRILDNRKDYFIRVLSKSNMSRYFLPFLTKKSFLPTQICHKLNGVQCIQ